MRNLTIILFLIFTVQTFATEVDDTTSYYDPIPDSEALLNARVQKHIDQTLKTFPHCNFKILADQAAKRLTGTVFYGTIESQTNRASQVPKVSPKVADSIYKNTPFETSVVGRIFGLASTVNIKGIHVGTDKIGHFLDVGYELLLMRRDGGDLMEMIDQSLGHQQALWGVWSTGVKSFGDLAANFDGYRFWADFAGEGANPYFKCENRKLKQIRAFQWSDYVSKAWNEAINCSDYSSEDYKFNMAKNIHGLEDKTGKRFSCPIVYEACDEIRAHYSQWLTAYELPKVISPECRLKPDIDWLN